MKTILRIHILFLVREKLEQELKEKEEEFEKEKQKFAEENPELAAQMEGSEDLIGGDDPQFKAIFDVQNHIQVKPYASQKSNKNVFILGTHY